MSKTKSIYFYTFKCTHYGCKETKKYAHESRKEYIEAQKRYSSTDWYCVKHDPSGGNVNPNSEPRTVVVVIECEREGEDNLWSVRGSTRASTRVSSTWDSPKWNADAADFPIGTRLIIETTIRVELPND